MRRPNIWIFAVLLSCGGCAASEDSADHPILGLRDDGTPKWAQRGSGAYEGDYGKAFYGVGVVQGVQNVALARQTADNRARGEIAALFDVYVARLMQDYQRSTGGRGGNEGNHRGAKISQRRKRRLRMSR